MSFGKPTFTEHRFPNEFPDEITPEIRVVSGASYVFVKRTFYGQKKSDKHRKIMRQGNLVLALPHISAYQLESDRRRKSLDKQVQRLRGSIARLDLYRNDLPVFLNDKFKLGVIIGFVVVQGVAVFYQRFSN